MSAFQVSDSGGLSQCQSGRDDNGTGLAVQLLQQLFSLCNTCVEGITADEAQTVRGDVSVNADNGDASSDSVVYGVCGLLGLAMQNDTGNAVSNSLVDSQCNLVRNEFLRTSKVPLSTDLVSSVADASLQCIKELQLAQRHDDAVDFAFAGQSSVFAFCSGSSGFLSLTASDHAGQQHSDDQEQRQDFFHCCFLHFLLFCSYWNKTQI